MRYFARVLAAALTLAAGAAEVTAADVADMILFNGKIVTVDDVFAIRQAVAVRGQRVLATGDNQAMHALAGPDTRSIDLKGRTVIPGLIDNHNHVIRASEHWAEEARLDGVTSRQQALAILRAKAAALPRDAWLFVLGGWSEDQFRDDQASFTLAELDQVAPDRPVFIQVQYNHALVNTAWLAAMGIEVAARRGDSAPGLARFVVRDSQGRASGRLDGGFPMIGQAIARFPAVDEARQIAGLNAMMGALNGMGLTTVFDPGGLGIQAASYARIQALAERGDLSLRFFSTLWGGVINTPAGADELIEKIKTTRPFQGNEWYRQIAVGEIIYAPFHWDDSLHAARPSPGDRAVAGRILSAAAAAGWPVQIHAIQRATIDQVLDLVTEVDRAHPVRALRWTITHGDAIGPDEIARAQALGMDLQLRSERVAGGLADFFKSLGAAGYQMPPLRLAQESGIRYGLGSDGTKAAQINPFITLWWATTGKMLNGEVIQKQVLTREEALIAHTRANAYFLFEEANLGAIKPGFLADLVVLDRDYMSVPLDDIKEIRPVATMVGGRFVYGAL